MNFITEKNILASSRNYTIPPFHIAEALNMSLSELYNVTLAQLEDILFNWKPTGLLAYVYSHERIYRVSQKNVNFKVRLFKDDLIV